MHIENSHLLFSALAVDRVLVKFSEHVIALPFLVHNVPAGANDSREWPEAGLDGPSRFFLRVTSTCKIMLRLSSNASGLNDS
jgi:hypothetical protein